MNLDWRNIRAINGSLQQGFEKLCVQLADAEKPDNSKFIATGNPDAGVECFAVLPRGSEWGWQAKYFPGPMETPQWRQLDDSVKTALDKHPSLVRYFVCAPLDLPDARIPGQTSARQRWEQRVAKWKGWAQERDMSVEFTWWGEHELTNILAKPRHIGRLQFWFGHLGLDNDWFRRRADEAVLAAGPRYTHEIHVDLPITHKLELFGRTESSLDDIKSLAIVIRRSLSAIASEGRQIEAPEASKQLSILTQAANTVVAELGSLEPLPAGEIPLKQLGLLADAAVVAADEAIDYLSKLDDTRQGRDASDHSSPIRRIVNDIRYLRYSLFQVQSAASEAEEITNSELLLLKGNAGTGKTHLLCDLAYRRIDSEAPTVLLMGHRFTEQSEPWQQALRLLSLPGANAEEFVGALEAAAQAHGKRALFIVDAVNESRGPEIWPKHLPAFLAPLNASPWISVVISVRSTYVDVVIPENVREASVPLTHEGFAGHEYDALKTFFEHYGLELPSSPMLNPEFQNPLFLKTICRGLQLRGDTRLPRGFQGITATFDMYLDAVNGSLAQDLDYNPGDQYVMRALSSIVQKIRDSDDQWLLSLPRSLAEDVVNELLPGQPFSRSLYHGLVREGLLFVDRVPHDKRPSEEIVHIAYERFADHAIAAFLLDQHLDPADPEAAFSLNGGLAFINHGKGSYLRQGLLEAMSIQVPERTGKELVEFAPNLRSHWHTAEAFLQSIIWRRSNAFSDSTIRIVNNLLFSTETLGNQSALEALLTVAIIDGHPLNADFLHRTLQQAAMPDRDAWWSIYLYDAWSWDASAVQRLISWAWEISQQADPDDRTIDLCTVTLAWMLTTSHRFVRDRATKALVNLLTGRLAAIRRMVKRFADVDDPYIVERVYAVAYGVAMRSRDPDGVGQLAQMVYAKVFESGTPPPHLLLRDYARGIIERAIHLEADIHIDLALIRPPYNSQWPKIPTEDEIQLLDRTLDQTPNNDDGSKYGWYAIKHSVQDWGDFARYIIGTDSWSRRWLTLSLNEEPWRSPEERKRELMSRLSLAEQTALAAYDDARSSALSTELLTLRMLNIDHDLLIDDQPAESEENNPDYVRANLMARLSRILASAIANAELEDARENLVATLSEEHRNEWGNIDEHERPPGLDPKIIQRYVLSRVVELGWSTERFGQFDRRPNSRYQYGRRPHKPERIGKKYQWIALHEILAFIADRYQFREGGERSYDGPWQIGRRDIDPSVVLASMSSEKKPTREHLTKWWAPLAYDNWRPELPAEQWISDDSDIPALDAGLVISQPLEPDTQWINTYGFQICRQPYSADTDPYDTERREVWLWTMACLVPKGTADRFIEWVLSGKYWDGQWQQSVLDLTINDVFLGEYGWSPAYLWQSEGNDPDLREWCHPSGSSPATAEIVVATHSIDGGGYDCSVDDGSGITVYLPTQAIINGCELRWTGSKGDYIDKNSVRAAFDPSAHEGGPNALLLSIAVLEKYLSDHDLELCWAVTGEKQILGTFGQPYGLLKMQGAYGYRNGKLVGKHNSEYIPRPYPTNNDISADEGSSAPLK